MNNSSVVEAKFIRGKIKSKSTTLWISTDNFKKESIQNKFHFDENEKPIICYFKNSSYWWLLTNMLLAIYNNDKITNYKLVDIERVELNNLFDGTIDKKEYSNLDLYIGNQHIQLGLEKGTWPIIYNIFKFIIRSPSDAGM
ncbi:hypothetical protein [Mucilaginibacter segetis]|uniref:Uncharacterized protein n=1 Tax=Mucilaginibacter segetis TaxID=2793071 RepID=A0A934PXH4_9SPHI|nr:hypothetical protein [Mucilaginibacter segetis]MBK0380891.1 hypothetical protein [Mucilaginibacter segetis]